MVVGFCGLEFSGFLGLGFSVFCGWVLKFVLDQARHLFSHLCGCFMCDIRYHLAVPLRFYVHVGLVPFFIDLRLFVDTGHGDRIQHHVFILAGDYVF